jgi:CubicO group peptidase (beta-lactamase class C family)
MHGTTSRVLTVLTAAALGLTACGDGGDPAADAGGVTTVAASSPPTTAPPPSDPPVTTSTATSAPPTEPPTVPTTVDDELAAQIEGVLTSAIAPGAMSWNANGVDIPPTAAVAAVRIPGRDDVLVAVGENVDGTAVEADAPFSVATLTESVVRTVAFQLIDEGTLDPTLTVDQWAPTLPNADRVTVQMVIDNETGWGDYGEILPDPVVTDFERAWTLQETVDLRATAMAALGEPGTRTDDRSTGEQVLGLIVEQAGGQPLAELVHERVALPAGLDDTRLLDGYAVPDRYRNGVFPFEGTAMDTSMFSGTSYLTWNLATHSMVSTPIDLLDLLDAWTTGELFTTDRAPAPDRYAPDPAGNPDTKVGLGVPFNAYCPCTDVAGGIEPTSIGRSPTSLGTQTVLLRYGDGISIMVNFNSGETDDPALRDVFTAVHDLAAAAS